MAQDFSKTVSENKIKSLTNLHGGFEYGIINNIYGPAGSGKTLICMLLCIEVIKSGKRVIYIDTEEGFSIERFKQLTDENILDKILFLKPNNFEEQKKVFDSLRNLFSDDIGLIVVDSISMLYRLELGKNEQVYNINRELGTQVSFLSEIAREKKIGIILTSHVYSDFDNKDKIKMVGGDFLKYSSKCLIELQNLKDGVKRAELIRHRSLPNREYLFRISKEGIKEI